jgi:predicted RNase H-like nuclease (RuvC/YqgF family)
MYDKWNKYTHVCQTCDALIEYTSKRVVREITCECGGRCNWVSQEPATITPTNERQQMEIVTNDEQVNALQTRITNLELMIESYQRQLSSSSERYNELLSQINRIIDNMTYDYWYNPNTDSETILSDLCDILNHEPKREVSFAAVMHFNGRIDVPLSDWDTFDLTEYLSETYVDINNGDVVIDDYELTEADEA